MNFKFYHDTEKKALAIPHAALQLSKLADAEVLTIHTERGCVLLTRDDLTVGETVGCIKLLTDLFNSLISQLAEASQDAVDEGSDNEGCVYPLTISNRLLAEAGISAGTNLDIKAGDGQIVITGREEDANDPLRCYDIDLLTMLEAYDVDLNGLRSLLEIESMSDE